MFFLKYLFEQTLSVLIDDESEQNIFILGLNF